jgi:hypothetical protein
MALRDPARGAVTGSPRRCTAAAVTGALSLAIAAAFGFGIPVAAALRPARPLLGWRVGPVEKLDPALSQFRPYLTNGARVGYVVSRDPKAPDANNDDVGRFCAVQYALAPALVRSIVIGQCQAHGPEACGLTQVGFLVARGARPAGIASFADELGFLPAAQASGFVLLARKAP